MNTINNNLEPIFIVCNARREPSLLRSILNRHESIACLSELDLCYLVLAIKNILKRFEGEDGNNSDVIEESIPIDTKKYVDQLIRSRWEKAIWCEESIFTVNHLELMSSVFPQGRYVLLVRHSIEFIRAALEESKSGLKDLGFDDHVCNSMGNIVDAIAKFWCENVEKMLEFEKSERAPIFRIKYEDILSDTDRTLGDLFEFLELDFDASLIDNIFSNKKIGAGDPKIGFTDKIETGNSKGKRAVPVTMITPETFEWMNCLLSELKYEAVDRNWGMVNRAYSTNLDGNETVVSSSDVKMIVEFLSGKLNDSIPPESIKEEILELNIQGIDTSPWLIDFSLRSFSKGPRSPKKPTIKVSLNISTFLEVLNDEKNLWHIMRDGQAFVDGDAEVANHIAKYFFLGTSVL